jgi:predicted metalloprotease with PDZ domain
VAIKPYSTWRNVATGLDSISGNRFVYVAPDYDILYDSPILVGNLEELPPFFVKGIPHRFIVYKPGEFDKVSFMNDLKKIVETATTLIEIFLTSITLLLVLDRAPVALSI